MGNSSNKLGLLMFFFNPQTSSTLPGHISMYSVNAIAFQQSIPLDNPQDSGNLNKIPSFSILFLLTKDENMKNQGVK